MNKLEIFFKSPASWSIIGVFLVQLLTALQPQLSGNLAVVVQMILTILAAYLHPSEIKVAGTEQTLGGKRI